MKMNMTLQPKVCIVILNFNGLSKFGMVFKRCLKSILKTNYNNLKICFVDNGSTDNSIQYVESISDPRIIVVKLRRNFGWSGGNNRGALFCRDCKYIAFVNNDIEIIDPQWITKLIKILESKPNIGVIQPLIFNKDGSVSLGFSMGQLGFPKLRKYKDIYRPLFYVSGAALITRADLFFKLGGFDESLFLLHDDLDYSWRCLLAGYEVKVSKSVRVFHYGSKTFGSSPYIKAKQIYYMIRNNIWIIYRNYSLKTFLRVLPLTLLATKVSFLMRALINKESYKVKSVILGLFHGFLHMNRRSNVKKIKAIDYAEVLKKMDKRIDIDVLAPWIRKLFKVKL